MVLVKRLFLGNMVCARVPLPLEFNVIMGLQSCASKAGDIYYTAAPVHGTDIVYSSRNHRNMS